MQNSCGACGQRSPTYLISRPTAALPSQNTSELLVCAALALFQATSLFGAQGRCFVPASRESSLSLGCTRVSLAKIRLSSVDYFTRSESVLLCIGCVLRGLNFNTFSPLVCIWLHHWWRERRQLSFDYLNCSTKGRKHHAISYHQKFI